MVVRELTVFCHENLLHPVCSARGMLPAPTVHIPPPSDLMSAQAAGPVEWVRTWLVGVWRLLCGWEWSLQWVAVPLVVVLIAALIGLLISEYLRERRNSSDD